MLVGLLALVVVAGAYELPRLLRGPEEAQRKNAVPVIGLGGSPGASVEDRLRRELTLQATAQAKAQQLVRQYWKEPGPPAFPYADQHVEGMGGSLYRVSGLVTYQEEGVERSLTYSCELDADEKASHVLFLRLGSETVPLAPEEEKSSAVPGR
jgi:hypothetical protein